MLEFTRQNRKHFKVFYILWLGINIYIVFNRNAPFLLPDILPMGQVISGSYSYGDPPTGAFSINITYEKEFKLSSGF